jgi:hypothetical protein
MVLKLRLKGEQIKEYNDILTAYSTENEETKEKIFVIVSKSGSVQISMNEVKGFTVVECGRGVMNG